MKTNNQEIIKLQKRMYDAITVTSLSIFIFTFVFALIPKQYEKLPLQEQELAEIIINSICAVISLCALINFGVFYLMRLSGKKEELEVLDGE